MTRQGSAARRYSKVFDEVAAEYDRHRPTYPDELVDRGAFMSPHSSPARASSHSPGRTWRVLKRWNL